MPEVNDLLEKIRPSNRTVIDATRVAQEAGGKLTIETRTLLPEPPRERKRAESLARAHEFFSASALAAYLARYGGEGTVVFADPVEETVFATLDERATNGRETVVMKPATHPLWKPWEDASDDGAGLSVEDFGEAIGRNRRAVIFPDAKELIYLFAQIRAVVKVEINRGRGKSAINGLMVTTEIQGQKTTQNVELPDEIVLRVPLYVDTSAREIPIDLCVEASAHGGVTIALSAGTVAQAKVEAFTEMLKVIEGACAEKGATFTLGRPKDAAWRYLAEIGEPATR